MTIDATMEAANRTICPAQPLHTTCRRSTVIVENGSGLTWLNDSSADQKLMDDAARSRYIAYRSYRPRRRSCAGKRPTR